MAFFKTVRTALPSASPDSRTASRTDASRELTEAIPRSAASSALSSSSYSSGVMRRFAGTGDFRGILRGSWSSLPWCGLIPPCFCSGSVLDGPKFPWRLGRGDDSKKPVLLTDHAGRFLWSLLVIIAQEVQDPMYKKLRDFLIEAVPE